MLETLDKDLLLSAAALEAEGTALAFLVGLATTGGDGLRFLFLLASNDFMLTSKQQNESGNDRDTREITITVQIFRQFLLVDELLESIPAFFRKMRSLHHHIKIGHPLLFERFQFDGVGLQTTEFVLDRLGYLLHDVLPVALVLFRYVRRKRTVTCRKVLLQILEAKFYTCGFRKS